MRRIQNKQNGRIAQVTDTYEKDGVVITYELTYEDDGKTTNLSSSTVKRWWKDINEEPVEEADKYVAASQAITKELNKHNSKSLQEMVDAQAESTASDGTSYSQVLSEIIQDEKVAVEKIKKEKEKKDETRKNGKSKVTAKSTISTEKKAAIKQNIMDIAISCQLESTEYAKLPNFVVLKAFGRGKVEARIGKDKITVNVKEDVAISSKLSYHIVNNYYLPAVIQLSYESDYDTELKNLFTLAYEKSENTKKSQKEEK